jgi:phage protein GP46|uniref:Phage protein GP46 n=1 Tax=Myoviridae sp. ct2AC8 TaxID=2827655 RepID=A0A8S5TPR5_9CAUD|nr:MAG TPA: hypothetical protein [Myoviridae sp. ct2AC8]
MTQIIDINNLDIETVSDELLQAILIAVFTDARAADDELPEYVKGSRGGWFGDKVETIINGKQTSFSWGSKLWMLKRAKMTEDEAGLAELLIQDSLTPLNNAGVIDENTVTVKKSGNTLILTITLSMETYEIRGIEQWLGR